MSSYYVKMVDKYPIIMTLISLEESQGVNVMLSVGPQEFIASSLHLEKLLLVGSSVTLF